MEVLEWITAIMLVLGIGMAGVMKLMQNEMATDIADRLGYRDRMTIIGVAEVAGAIGVVIGAISSDLEWIGVLAAIGIILLMAGALMHHQRAGDSGKDLAPPAVLALVAVVYIIALFAN
ncbi:MAG: DoxX family protein [Acidimicrobiales bacterium]